MVELLELVLKKIEIKNDELDFLNVGDIIQAKRYRTDEEKLKIKKGHRESPFVVIMKNKGGVYVLQCTSNPHFEIKWKMVYYYLSRLKYGFQKSTYINCTTLYKLEHIQFIEIIGRLDDADLNQLKKQIYLLQERAFNLKADIPMKYLDFTLGVGDVVLYNDEKYFINNIIGKTFEIFKLRKNVKSKNRILINNTYYSFIFDEIYFLKKNKIYSLVDSFNSGEVALIRNHKESLLSKNATNNDLRVGDLINYKNNMFYIYGFKSNWVLVYMVYSKFDFQKGMSSIIVSGVIYMTLFNAAIINTTALKRNGFSIRERASEDEIEYNAKVFNASKQERNRMRNELKKKLSIDKYNNIDILVPMVILNNSTNGNYYLIIERKDDIIEMVNINDFSDLIQFKLERGNCPLKYYKVMPKEEFDKYVQKVNDFKSLVNKFN